MDISFRLQNTMSFCTRKSPKTRGSFTYIKQLKFSNAALFRAKNMGAKFLQDIYLYYVVNLGLAGSNLLQTMLNPSSPTAVVIFVRCYILFRK